MKNSSTEKLVLKYLIKVFVSTVLSVLLFTSLFSYVIYKADLSMDTAKICSLFIIALSAFFITAISVYGLKNNGILTGVLSQIPLLFYSLINTVFNDNSWLLFFIKVIIMLLISTFTGYVITLKSKRLKIK